MKKKGLIVATIVMVLVLAVSLSTATYAWFSASKETTIEKITFSVSTGSDVSIGLSSTNTYQSGAGTSAFVFGQTTIGEAYATTSGSNSTPTTGQLQAGTGYWVGDPGLGNHIDMQLDLDGITKAVGTGKTGATADGTFNFAAIRTLATSENTGMIRSEGIGTTASANGAEEALGQKDYLDVVIGVQAAAADLYGIICNVTINPDSANVDLGMNAAIHVAYRIDGMIDATNKTEVDAYGSSTYATTLSSLGLTKVDSNTNTVAYGGSATQTLNPGAINIPIVVAGDTTTTTGTDFLDRQTIYQIHLLIWIDGTDPDCCDQAKGVSSEIYINFSTNHPVRTAESGT